MNSKQKIGYFLTFILFGCSSNFDRSNANLSDSDSYIVVVDSNLLKNKNKTSLDFFIETHADSINNWEIGGTAPLFLENTQLDFQYSGIFSTFHNPISLRMHIVDKVMNCKSLRLILDDKSGIYKTKPKKIENIEVPFIEFSLYELAEKRARKLNCQYK